MEAHPVPKNVLNVEFKLFGSLSVRQFGKVLGGSVIAVLLYFATANLGVPVLITGPLMVISVLVGVGAALIPEFETKLNGLVKAIFVSPRYVWKKDTKAPEILSNTRRASTNNASAKPGSQQSQPEVVPTVDDLSIDQILDARSVYSQEVGVANQALESSNFEKIYDQQFQSQPQEPEAASVPQATQKPKVRIEQLPRPGVQASSAAEQVQQPIEQAVTQQVPAQPQQPSVEIVKAEIEGLRKQLAVLNKQEGNQEQKQAIVAQINQKLDQLGISTPQKRENLPTTSIELDQSKVTPLFGFVVDKKDKPITNAVIKVLDLNQQEIGIQGDTEEDGKFAIPIPSELNEVIIAIEKSGHRFLPFKVKLNQGRMPAFKFREH